MCITVPFSKTKLTPSSVCVGQRPDGLDIFSAVANVLRLNGTREPSAPVISLSYDQFNGMLKTTSLASVISMEELMRNAQMLAQINFRVLEVYSVAALWYLLLVSIWGLIQQRIEAHYEKPFGPAAAISPEAAKELKKAMQKAGATKV